MRGPHQGPKQTLGAATRVRSTSGVSVRFMLDERSTIWRKRAGLATEGSSFWTSAPCQAAAGLDSGALPFPRYCALLVQTKPDRHAKGSPSGGNGDDRRQRRKQGGAVGAAASRMQAAAQQTLGAATRHGRGAPERARMLTKNWERDDSIALTKSLPIAAQRLFRAGLALSVIASQCHLSQRERLWQSPQSERFRQRLPY